MSEPVAPSPPALTARGRAGSHADTVLLACGLAWLAGLIHIQAAIDHFDEYVPYALLFIVLAAAQLLWGVALYRGRGRRLLYAGLLGSVAVIVAWLASRTVGLPFGPDLGSPEPVGILDVVATIDELAIAALMTLALRPLRASRQATAVRTLNAGALFLVVVSSLVLAGGLHAH